MKQIYTLIQIKKYLKSLPALKFSEEIELPATGVEFLSKFFEYNLKFDTIEVESGNTQTKKGKRRSIGDIYRITCYYYPKIKISTVYETLLKLINEKVACSALCAATGLRVYRKHQPPELPFCTGAPFDEFTVDLTQFENYNKELKDTTSGWGHEFGEKVIKIIEI